MASTADTHPQVHGPGTHRHDWRSPDYVTRWIDHDVTRDGVRRAEWIRLAALLPRPTDRPVNVLDVGAGYGAVSRIVLDTVPEARVVWHDYSPAMLTAARDNLGEFGDRITFRVSDLASPEWTAELGGPFDAVVSARAIHNLFDPTAIARVYRDVHTLLRPGGLFLDADLIYPSGPGLFALYERDARHDPSSNPAAARASGGIAAHLRWLEEAGFAEVDCLTKDLTHATLCALRGE
jgi:tRNA (cmo5U34)-methyltransferase